MARMLVKMVFTDNHLTAVQYRFTIKFRIAIQIGHAMHFIQ